MRAVCLLFCNIFMSTDRPSGDRNSVWVGAALIVVTALHFPLKQRLPRIRVFPVFIDGIGTVLLVPVVTVKTIRYTKRSVAVWESFRCVVCCCHCSCACLLHFDYRICNDPCHTVNALSPNMYIIVVQCNKFFFFFYV